MGFAPTLEDLSQRLGISTSSVYDRVQSLVRKGVLAYEPHEARSLRVVGAGGGRPMTPRPSDARRAAARRRIVLARRLSRLLAEMDQLKRRQASGQSVGRLVEATGAEVATVDAQLAALAAVL